jgi:HEPN domain-containing protein
MKEKADLTAGWLRKAASDMMAAEAAQNAGAPDAACFHAQQAAEKYLKAFLIDRGMEFPHTHNLPKLLGICGGQGQIFESVQSDAELLTPYAVQVRYDFDFWPAADGVRRAIEAAVRIRECVVAQLSPAQQWRRGLEEFDWKADLRDFRDHEEYPGFFDREITTSDLKRFEQEFQDSLDSGDFQRSGEVCFWKNFGDPRASHKLTSRLLEHLKNQADWSSFRDALKLLAARPTFENFDAFRRACSEKNGFATPIAFLAFHMPDRYPMVDRHVADWWQRNAGRFEFPEPGTFSRRKDGWIYGVKRSWDAYLRWTDFCRQTAGRLADLSKQLWRPRDVEMAVLTAGKKSIALPELPPASSRTAE